MKIDTNKFKGPTFRYGPNGEAEIFTNSDHVPAGWTDNPKTAARLDPAAETELTREQIIDALNAREVPFKKNAFTKVLLNLLNEFNANDES